jgi:uncharacterized protein YbaA (DUF1428 family)
METYVDGFVLPVPEDGIGKYREIATKAAALWIEHGALEYRETVLEDPTCQDTISFPALAGVKEGETVAFAYIAYKSREDRDQVNAKVMADPRLSCGEDCPFDYKRMAYGGFRTIVEGRSPTYVASVDQYVDGFVLPVRTDGIERYREIASKAAEVWLEYGALDYRECVLEDPTSHDMVSYPALASVKDDETVVFAYIVYKSREDRDQVNAKVMADPRMNCDDCPFDPKRIGFGGFRTIVNA